MRRRTTNGSTGEPRKQLAGYSGTSSLEVIMAFTLLSSVLGVSTSLIVRHQRLIIVQREYRLALDEASNQLDRLSNVPLDELSTAVDGLWPSNFLAARLPGAKLKGEIAALETGKRVKISVSWGDELRTAAPVTLAAWFFPEAVNSSQSTVRGAAP